MKTLFLIQSYHTVHIDDYNMGELDYVNTWDTEAQIYAENADQVINDYLQNHLYYNLDIKCGEVDKDANCFRTSLLVDNDNLQPTSAEVDAWKKGELTLFSMDIELHLYTINEVILK